jgi:hypothetical protein
MTANQAQQIEMSLKQRALSALAQHRQALARDDIVFTEPEIEVSKSEPSTRTSEIRVEFHRQGQLEDIFEFDLFRDGQQIVTSEEIDVWIHENVPQLLRKT